MRDSVVIYKSFHEASKMLPPDKYKELWVSIFEYAMNEEEPEFDDTLEEIIFTMAQPQIDANNKRAADGAKGGRPKKTSGYENENHRLQNQKPNVNVNVNVNDNVNKKRNIKEKTPALIKNKYGERENVLLTENEYIKLGVDYGEAKRALMIKRLDEYIVDNPKYKTQKDHNLAIRRWVAKAIEEDQQRPHKKTPGDLMMNHNYTPEEYAAQEKALLAID